MIHVHQNILYFLEIATSVLAGTYQTNESISTSKFTLMKKNIEVALQSLHCICNLRKGQEPMYCDVISMIKRIEVLKRGGKQSLSDFEQTLIQIETKQCIDSIPVPEKKSILKNSKA